MHSLYKVFQSRYLTFLYAIKLYLLAKMSHKIVINVCKLIKITDYSFLLKFTNNDEPWFQDSTRTHRTKLVVDRPCNTSELSKSAIQFDVRRLTEAVFRLYNQWAAEPEAVGPDFRRSLCTLVGRLKWLARDIDVTADTYDQLAVLVEHYDAYRNEYIRLSRQLDCIDFTPPPKNTYTVKWASENPFHDGVGYFICKCKAAKHVKHKWMRNLVFIALLFT